VRGPDFVSELGENPHPSPLPFQGRGSRAEGQEFRRKKADGIRGLAECLVVGNPHSRLFPFQRRGLLESSAQLDGLREESRTSCPTWRTGRPRSFRTGTSPFLN
jgi:hypothetical protein